MADSIVVNIVENVSPITVRESGNLVNIEAIVNPSAPLVSIFAAGGLEGGGLLDENRTISLNAATQLSLSKADSALQPSGDGSLLVGITSGQIEGLEYFYPSSNPSGFSTVGQLEDASGHLQSQLNDLDLNYASQEEINNLSGELGGVRNTANSAVQSGNLGNAAYLNTGITSGTVAAGNDGVTAKFGNITEAGISIATTDAVFPITRIEVRSGHGSVNRDYIPSGTLNSKPAYYYAGGDQDDKIYWLGSEWRITATFVPGRYYSPENVATPDLVTSWLATGIFTMPAPIVTAVRQEPTDDGLALLSASGKSTQKSLLDIDDLETWTGNATGLFYPRNSNPSGYATVSSLNSTGQTLTALITGVSGHLQGEITNLSSHTGDYYPHTNPSGFINSTLTHALSHGYGEMDAVTLTRDQISDLPVFGDSVELNVGTTSGTVAAGDHFHYIEEISGFNPNDYQPAGDYLTSIPSDVVRATGTIGIEATDGHIMINQAVVDSGGFHSLFGGTFYSINGLISQTSPGGWTSRPVVNLESGILYGLINEPNTVFGESGIHTLNWQNGQMYSYSVHSENSGLSGVGTLSLDWMRRGLSGDWSTDTVPTLSQHLINKNYLETSNAALQSGFSEDINSLYTSLYNTGQTLNDNITSLSGALNNTGALLISELTNYVQKSETGIFATSANLAITGSNLQSQLNDLQILAIAYAIAL